MGVRVVMPSANGHWWLVWGRRVDREGQELDGFFGGQVGDEWALQLYCYLVHQTNSKHVEPILDVR